jgi:hypothetical protein
MSILVYFDRANSSSSSLEGPDKNKKKSLQFLSFVIYIGGITVYATGYYFLAYFFASST